MRFIGPALLVLALAACGGNPLNNGGPGSGSSSGGTTGGGTTTVPAELAVNLSSAVYDSTNGTLIVTLPPFDGSPVAAAYQRNASLDIGSYKAFDLEENAAARRYIALFQTAGDVTAGAVATEYRYANQYGGTTYGRADVYTGPTTGIASYQGTYAAVLTVPIDDTDPNPSVRGPIRVTGAARLNVDFNQQLVEGNITGRKIVDDPATLIGLASTAYGTNGTLSDVELQQTALSSGTYNGNVTTPGGNKLGTYGGVVGAGTASAPGANVAGVVVFTPTEFGSNKNYTEYGALVLPLSCYSTAGHPCP